MKRYAAGLVTGIVLVISATAFAVAFKDPGVQGPSDTGGYPAWGADQSVTVTATDADTTALSAGVYAVWCDIDVWADQGTTGVAAVSGERPISAKTTYPVRVSGNSDTLISFLRQGATSGTCIVSKDTYGTL